MRWLLTLLVHAVGRHVHIVHSCALERPACAHRYLESAFVPLLHLLLLAQNAAGCCCQEVAAW